ncbi:MAG: hypothetical protein AABW89_05185 [Nanoarchaeota archaeon]
MVNQHKVNDFDNPLIEALRKPDIPRVYSLYTHLNELNLHPYFIDYPNRHTNYNQIILAAIFHTQTEDQKRLLEDIRNADGSRITLGDHRFNARFNQPEGYGLGTAILVPVRTFWERIPFTQKPRDIELRLADPEGIRRSLEIMDMDL